MASFFSVRRQPTEDEDRYVAQGRADLTTNAAITVTVYVTPQTK
jgi:hypothetical protein